MEPPSKVRKVEPNGHKLQILGRDEYLSKVEKVRKEKCKPIAAMYSSVVDGILTDPVLMSVPIDDHIVCRGHAVFEASTVVNGKLFRLDNHLDRLFRSAKSARIPLPFGDDEEVNRAKLVSVIAQTVVTTGLKNAGIRIYLSVGYGDFNITPEGVIKNTALYIVVMADKGSWASEIKGINEVTVGAETIPIKPALLANTKTNNYLLNALGAMAAQDKGGFRGIGVDAKGYITESAIANVAFVTSDRRFVTPKFDAILAGTTVQKLMQCAKKLVAEGVLTGVSQEDVVASEARTWPEALLCGGDTHISPITSWDGKPIGTGKVGDVTKKLIGMLQEQAEAEDNPADHYVLTY